MTCGHCGWDVPTGYRQCPSCRTWLRRGRRERVRGSEPPRPTSSTGPVRSTAGADTRPQRLRSGVDAFDRALSGGLVVGAVAVIAGDPGAGKSTLLGQVVAGIAEQHQAAALFASGEESSDDIRARLRRTGSNHAEVWVTEAATFDEVVSEAEQVDARVLVIDSLQTLTVKGKAAGSRGAMVLGIAELVAWARQRRVAVVLVLQVDKQGDPAGPRAVEHAAHASMKLEVNGGKRRKLRVPKNRHGEAPRSSKMLMGKRGLA